jgi:hypothetical protein
MPAMVGLVLFILSILPGHLPVNKRPTGDHGTITDIGAPANPPAATSRKPIPFARTVSSSLSHSVTLRVVPEPPEGSRLVLRLKQGTTILRGESNLDLHCGNCGSLLAEGIARGQFPDIVLFCNACGLFNDTGDCTFN